MMRQWLKCHCEAMWSRVSFPKRFGVFELRVRFRGVREQFTAARLLISGDESRREGAVASFGGIP